MLADSSDIELLPRTIEQVLREASGIFKVILLTGMREAGKRTALSHVFGKGRNQASLDDYLTLEAAENAPSSFFINHPIPVCVNEIQRTPGFLRQVKAEVDKRDGNGLVLLTGTQRFELMRGVSESLAGRMKAFELMPLSIYEREGKGLLQKPYLPRPVPPSVLATRGSDETWETIWQGAWPRVMYLEANERNQFFGSLVQSYLERDVQREFGVTKLIGFHRFLRVLASRTGQELRYGALAREAGVAENTIRKWLRIAEATGVVYFLMPYFANIGKQLVRSPKVYFTDTGLAAYLCGYSTPEALRDSRDSGAFFETFVVMEILKSWVHNGERPELSFYRDSNSGAEIDLLIRSDRTLHPVEIKLAAQPDRHAARNFSVLKSLPEPIGHGAVVCLAPKPYGITDRCTAHSVWSI